MQSVMLFLWVLSPAAAVLLEGFYRKTIARMQSRKGPPVVQPFYDLRKLWNKRRVKTKNDWFFLISPFFYTVTVLIGLLIVPFHILSFEYDFIFLLYITVLSSAFYVLAGISSDSPYGMLASMREMRLMVIYETALAAALLSFVVYSGTLTISGVKPLSVIYLLPSAVALIAVIFVENKVTQFDTGAAESEILPGVSTEYSGKALFFLDLGEMMKRFLFLSLVSALFAGDNMLFFAVSFVILFMAMAYSDATTPRFTLHVTTWYVLAALILAVIDLLRVIWVSGWA